MNLSCWPTHLSPLAHANGKAILFAWQYCISLSPSLSLSLSLSHLSPSLSLFLSISLPLTRAISPSQARSPLFLFPFSWWIYSISSRIYSLILPSRPAHFTLAICITQMFLQEVSHVITIMPNEMWQGNRPWYPLRGNHQCVICMKCRIIICISIIISRGQILV